MIHFKIKQSSDESVVGDYQINYDDFVIGPKTGADLVIDDPALSKPILLKVTAAGLKITCENYFLLQGKKISGSKILKPGDLLEVGTSQIQIIAWSVSSLSQGMNIIERLEERVRSEPEISDLVIELEKELIRIETERLTNEKRS